MTYQAIFGAGVGPQMFFWAYSVGLIIFILSDERWAATTFFGKTSTPFFSILSIPSYTICNKQYTICNSRAYFPLPRLVFDGWRLLSEALFCNRTTCPLITRLRLSQLFCPLLNN